MFRSARSATIFTDMYWRNILDVACEERLHLMRERAISEPPSSEAPAMIGRRNAEGDFKAPSIEGLEVVEVTVLDIAPAAAPR